MEKKSTILRMEQPATHWQDAIPCGNGKIGAMMYGNIADECILLNHEDLWLPIFEGVRNVEMSKYIPKYRELLEKGLCHEADAYWKSALKEAGWPEFTYSNPAHPAFDMLIRQTTGGLFYDYERSLDMESGEAKTVWRIDDCVFERRMFVSRADDMVVLQMAGSKPGKLNMQIQLKKHPFCKGFYPKELSENELPIRFVKNDNGNTMIFRGIYPDNSGYVGTAYIYVGDGQLKSESNGVRVQNSSKVTVFIKIDKTDKPLKLKHEFDDDMSYEEALARHKSIHSELFNRIALNIGRTSEENKTNEALIRETYVGNPPAELYEKLFYYGRYLFISSTPRVGLPPNLQGVWNGEYLPAWCSAYTLDENIQMMHWQVMPGNMPELMEPYLAFVEESLADWRENARNFYGCNGIVACLAKATHSLLSENMPYLMITCVAGWLASDFYSYYRYTQDEEFLKNRALPIMEETALFYKEYSYMNDEGNIAIAPAVSPENTPEVEEKGYKFDPWIRSSVSPTIDIAVFKELLINLKEVYTLLGEEAKAKECGEWLSKFADYRINDDGALAEWQHPKYGDHYTHRHYSHMYPVFPGREIDEDNPTMMDASRVAMEKRREAGIKGFTCWGLIHAALIYIRLFDAEKANDYLKCIMKACLKNNFLMNIYDIRGMGVASNGLVGTPYTVPICQLDANMGFTAVITDMIIRSTDDTIYILSALPPNWECGSIEGVCCVGKISALVLWNQEKIELVCSGCGSRVVKFPQKVKGGRIEKANGENLDFTGCEINVDIDGELKIIGFFGC